MTGRLMFQLAVGLLLVVGGAAACWYAKAMWRAATKRPWLKTGPVFLGEFQTVWSIRSGGVVAIITGSFLIWMYWRHR